MFGQFLSSFRVVHPVPRDESIETLARALSAQTALAKRLKLYLVTLVAMGAAALLWPFAETDRRQRLYLKYHPVFAGFTPLNVNALRRRGRSRDGDYLRAASTGPMSPMVVAVTTSGAALRIGITFRTTALTRDGCGRGDRVHRTRHGCVVMNRTLIVASQDRYRRDGSPARCVCSCTAFR